MPNEPKITGEKLRQAIPLQPGERLYGVVDGAQDLELAYEAKCLFGQEITSLFAGDMAAAAADVAPYLVPIDPASGYLENWAQRWGKNAGILLTTTAEPARLHAHLREIFVVQDEQGQPFFFRYYDPRVLRAYLPTCNAHELAAFFDQVSAYLTENEESSALLSFRVERSKLGQEIKLATSTCSFATDGRSPRDDQHHDIPAGMESRV